MLFLTIAFFLLAGLSVLGEAVRRLWMMELDQMNPLPAPQPPAKEEPGPKLTRLGRPITEIKLSV
ncbi:MAG: hypothetical protein O3B73_03865 [bacterium]|jgi:hypothetical protein|nr:hypothetical protein [bacterium]